MPVGIPLLLEDQRNIDLERYGFAILLRRRVTRLPHAGDRALVEAEPHGSQHLDVVGLAVVVDGER